MSLERFSCFSLGIGILLVLMCGCIWLETIVLQWLLAQFGLVVGFWKALCILMAMDFLFGVLFRCGRSNK